MTRKARLLAACAHQPTDRVPLYHASISSRAASLLLGREAHVGGAIQQWREAVALWNGEQAHREFLQRTLRDTVEVAKALDVDLVRASYWRMPEKPTRKLDDHTFLYGDPDRSWRVMRFDPETELYQVVDQSQRPACPWAGAHVATAREPTEQDLEAQVERMERNLDDFDPRAAYFYADIAAVLQAFGGERAVAAIGVGVAVPNRSALWYELVAARPDLVKRLVQVQTEHALRRINAYAEMDVQLLLGGGDMASSQGPIYSPRFFREVMAPAFHRLTQACHAVGKYYFFASDGDLWPIADDLFPVVDGFYEIDRRAGMDLRRLRERFPHLILVGNLSSYTLHLGTKEQVIEETLSCLQAAKECGGIIVGASNLIVPQTPEPNLRAMLDTLRDSR